jgi:hypothetical protein
MSRVNNLKGGAGGASVGCPAGVTCPVVSSMPGQTPGQSAAINFQANAAQSAALGNIGSGGGRKKKLYGGQATNNITVPTLPTPYPTVGPVTTNSTFKSGAIIGSQSTANAVGDQYALTGGKRRKSNKKGGNPNWVWGCHSGGRKMRRTNKKNRSKKGKKGSRKSRKH